MSDDQTGAAILLLGGRSEIGLAVVHALLAGAPGPVVLAQRPDPTRAADDEQERSRLLAAGATAVETVDFDATDLASHDPLVASLFDRMTVGTAVVAFGVLGDQEAAWQSVADAQRLLTVNATAAVGIGVALAGRMSAAGGGTIVALSSAAAVRVRPSNLVYGASKAAMDGFFGQLGGKLAGRGVRVLLVRPGVVATRMVAGRPPVPLTVTPQRVARAVRSALGRPGPWPGTRVVHVPWPFVPVLAVSRLLPESLWRRLNM